jgi:hypothetical protein
MEPFATAQADIEALKLLMTALIHTLPKADQGVLRANVERVLSRLEDRMLYSTMSDEQQTRAQEVARKLAGL